MTPSAAAPAVVAPGLLTRASYDEIPPRVEYEATEKADALFPAFGHIHRWAHEYRLEPADSEDEGDTAATDRGAEADH